jgi:putative ABC transport system permease protein
LLPAFNLFIDKHLILFFPGCGLFFIKTIAVSLVVGLIAGIYPSLFMASINTNLLLKAQLFHSTRSVLRKCLVTFQFMISLFLIITSIIVAQQLNFMLTKDLGFNKEDILFAHIFSSNKSGSFEDFRTRILEHPEVLDACVSDNIPFNWSDGAVVSWEGGSPGEKVDVRTNKVSYDFIRVFGMKITEGRDFTRSLPTDSGKSCIINETAVKTFGWGNPIGKTIGEGRWRVVGVVKDFHPYSVHEKIPPYLLELNPGNMQTTLFFTFKAAPGKLQEAKKILANELSQVFPNDPFEIKSMANQFSYEGTFKTYKTIRNTFFFFTILTILLTIFGLLGLVSFSTQRRLKEIGIRKINGSTVWNIFLLLNKEFMILIAVAAPFSICSVIYLYRFLPFVYRYGLHPALFIYATLAIILVSLITTSYFTLKAARQNPSETLRYE